MKVLRSIGSRIALASQRIEHDPLVISQFKSQGQGLDQRLLVSRLICGLSRPIFCKFCKVIVVADQPDLRFTPEVYYEAVACPQLACEFLGLHHCRVNFAAKLLLH